MLNLSIKGETSTRASRLVLLQQHGDAVQPALRWFLGAPSQRSSEIALSSRPWVFAAVQIEAWGRPVCKISLQRSIERRPPAIQSKRLADRLNPGNLAFAFGHKLRPAMLAMEWVRAGAASAALLGLALAGCSASRTPMQVEVTQLGPYVNAAKDPGCAMPVLSAMPLTTFRQVAIVEAWADPKDDQKEVLPALKRKACETGADALVILNSTHQDIKQLLYQASPNEQLNDTTKQNVYAGQGEYIKEMEHTRRIGEPGHNGFYVDAAAINYVNVEDKRASDNPLPQTSRPNG
jgi:hypothetical protein